MTVQDPITPDPHLDAWVREHLGVRVADVFFERHSMSRVFGVELDDGRRVALKVRADRHRIAMALRAQEAAIAAGIDCPEVIVGPITFGGAGDEWATAESWRDEGDVLPQSDVAAHFAKLLAAVNAALTAEPVPSVTPPPWLDYDHGDPSRTWPPPMADRWDPHRIEADMPPELLRLAATARARMLAAKLPRLLQHGDLNPSNVRWIVDGDQLRPLVHDWDSIVVAPEAVVAGEVAADLTMVPGDERLADVDTCALLFDGFGEARNRPLSLEEREVAWATTAWIGAYNAAFEYLHGAPGPISEQILADGAERLRRAGVGA